MRRNKKLNKIVENDLSTYKNDEFLSVLKERVSQNNASTRKNKVFRRTVWALSLTSVVVVSLVIVFSFVLLFNGLSQKNNFDNASGNSLNKMNSFVQNVKFKNIDEDEVYVCANSDKDKPYFKVSNDEVKIDVYSGNASLISENIYSEKRTASGFELNCYEQVFSENNDEQISISGFINTGTEILYVMYVKPLESENKEEFFRKENQNLVKILNDLIVVNK